MKLSGIPLLLDQNIRPGGLHWLRAAGLDAVSTLEVGLATAPDHSVLSSATEMGRALLTHDQDFGALAFVTEAPMIGIVLLRPSLGRGPLVTTLTELYRLDPDVTPPFFVVATRTAMGVQVRVRAR